MIDCQMSKSSRPSWVDASACELGVQRYAMFMLFYNDKQSTERLYARYVITQVRFGPTRAYRSHNAVVDSHSTTIKTTSNQQTNNKPTTNNITIHHRSIARVGDRGELPSVGASHDVEQSADIAVLWSWLSSRFVSNKVSDELTRCGKDERKPACDCRRVGDDADRQR